MIDSQQQPISVSNPLEQFILLAKSARGAAAANLLSQAMSSPNVYVFGELLNAPSVVELASAPEFKAHYDLLTIFAFGTYSDYVNNRSTLPQLNDQMAIKLRQLTIVSLATRNKHIPYVLLLKELGINNVRELEDLIIDAIYNGVIVGKLDQRNQKLEVDRCMGRDVKKEDIPKILDTLTNFCDRCQILLATMEDQIVRANRARSDAVSKKLQIEQEFNNIKKTLKAAAANSQGIGTPDFDDNILQDVSSTAEPPEKKNKEKSSSRRAGLRGSSSKTGKNN